MKILGELPKLDLAVSDEKLQQIIQLLQGVPFPEGSPEAPEDTLELDVSLKNMIPS